MKKTILILMCMVLLVSTISAFNFDNLKNYNLEKKEYTLKNAFGFGDEIANIKLNTPQNVNVGLGYQKVAEMTFINGKNNYEKIINGIELYNINNGMKEVIKKIDYKYKVIIDVPQYKSICKDEKNLIDCKNVLDGTRKVETWEDLDKKDLKEGETITIGLFTDVKEDEHIEWILNVYGNERLTKWAEWTADLNTGLISYYNFEEGSGMVIDQVSGINNLTNNGADNTTGKIGSAYDFVSANSDYMNATINNFPNGTDEITISLWVNMDATAADNQVPYMHYSALDATLTQLRMQYYGSTNMQYIQWGNTGTGLISASGIVEGTWTHFVVNYNGTAGNIYKNGTLVGQGASFSYAIAVAKELRIGFNAVDSVYMDGLVDEIGIWNRTLSQAEVTQLYNDGIGITYVSNFNRLTTTLNSPVDYFNSTPQSITFNCSATDEVGVVNLTLIIDGADNYTITNSSGGENLSLQTTVTNIADGNHNWTCRASDGSGDSGDPSTASVRYFNIDSIEPQINITALGAINYHIKDTNLSINWSFYDDNPGTCLLEYAGVNTTVTCANNGTYINATSYSNRNVTIWANDTSGNSNYSSMTWDYKIFENSVNYSASTIEGLNENFNINFTHPSSFPISQVELVYNGTSHTSTISQYGTNVMASNTILIPDFPANSNVSFNWNITFSDSSIINTTNYNQSVSILAGGNCTAYTNNIFNFTIVDEEFQNQLVNTSLEYFFDLYDSTGETQILNFSGNSSANPVSICLNVNLSTNSYSLDSIEKYSDDGYATEYYNIVDFTLNSSTPFQNIILYDLNSNDSTDFKITFQGSDFLPLANALIYIERQYIPDGNIFRTVELPKTDANGETIGHFVRNDIYYNIRVIKDGELVGNFPNVIAYCEDFSIGNCVIDLSATTTDQTTYDYNSELGIVFSQIPSFDNDTRLVSTSFSTDTGESKTITLTVTRSDIFGNNSVCNNSLTSSSGTVSCAVPAGISDTTLISEVYVDGNLAVLRNINVSTPPYDSIGYIVWFLLTLIFILIFAEDKTMIFVGLVFSYTGAVAMVITKGSIIGLGSAGIWIIVISVIGIWRLNKENSQ